MAFLSAGCSEGAAPEGNTHVHRARAVGTPPHRHASSSGFYAGA